MLRPEERIEAMVEQHLEYIASSSDALALEGFAFLTRHPEDRAARDEWYRWLSEHYAALIAQLRPELPLQDCRVRAFQILTVCLGAWFTLGASRPKLTDRATDQLKRDLLDAVQRILQA